MHEQQAELSPAPAKQQDPGASLRHVTSSSPEDKRELNRSFKSGSSRLD
jgi:hypothetical protein